MAGTTRSMPESSLDGHAPSPGEPCRSVYIYNASSLNSRWLEREALGEQLGPEAWLRDCEQHSTGAVLLSRLLRSKRCPLVPESRAHEAELFLIPLSLPSAREPTRAELEHGPWDFMPPNEEEQLWAGGCMRLANEDWRALLPHLTTDNVARHVIIPVEKTEIINMCRYAEPAFELLVESRPSNAELLTAMPRITTAPIDSNCESGCGSVTGKEGGGAFALQDLITAPLNSAVHIGQEDREGAPLPWALGPPGARPFLMSFGGSELGFPKAAELRRLLVGKCRSYGNATCQLVTARTMNQREMLSAALKAKRESVFCLEPPGFADHRKSQLDSLGLGCIPVLFGRGPGHDAGLWPLHWQSWRAESRVLLDIDEVLSGRIDVLEHLRSIPSARVRSMQSAIATHANRILFGAGDTSGDAVEVLLNAIVHRATARSRRRESTREDSYGWKCDDAWPRRVTQSLIDVLTKADERWHPKRLPTCAAIIQVWGCGATVPTRKSGFLVRDLLCRASCQQCTRS